LGLIRKPSLDSAPAATEVRYRLGEIAVTWYGAPELLVRSPHVYLDWAVNKDRRQPALEFLAEVLGFIEESAGDRLIQGAWTHVEELADPVAIEVTVTYTASMRCKTAFRPRTAITEWLYPTFWHLWNELVLRVQDPEAIEPLVDDLRTQIEWYDQHGVGSRGGAAPIHASRIGAGRRLDQEIADFGGLSVEQFRALPERERDEIYERHAAENVRRAMSSDEIASRMEEEAD
jgi:hypothetical protein